MIQQCYHCKLWLPDTKNYLFKEVCLDKSCIVAFIRHMQKMKKYTVSNKSDYYGRYYGRIE